MMMRSLSIATLLIAALLLQPACTPKREEPKQPISEPTTAIDPEARGKQDVTICIKSNQVDIPMARVKANKKQGFGWKSHDSRYVIEFADDQWGFTEEPDSSATGFKMVVVPANANSRSFTLSYALPPDSTRMHYYRIGGGPPDGPAIIGGD